MNHFKRTALGEKELLARALKLNARTRTLLLLLESDDLKQLNISAREKIASPENYQTLMDLELIIQVGAAVSSVAEPIVSDPVDQIVQANTVATFNAENISTQEPAPVIKESTFAAEHVQDTFMEIQHVVAEPSPAKVEQEINIEDMDFMQLKELMQQTLKQYCGLMAKNLVMAIGQSNSVQEMRQHQSKWLTSLFETRISRQQLNQLLNTINHNMDRIEFMNGEHA